MYVYALIIHLCVQCILCTCACVQMSTKNFALVRRTGLDWHSLLDPACLPLTTDYFPSETVLSADYFEYPTKLVVNSYGNEHESHEKK